MKFEDHLSVGTDGETIDLDAYLNRLGAGRPSVPSVDALRDLHKRHVGAIAFEAIDVLLGQEIDLQPQRLEAKLVVAGRGGYCFEQNMLFRYALEALGFDVELLIARSRWGRPLEDVRPRTHMALRVRLDGRDWLCDVGSPRSILAAPLLMSDHRPQASAFEPLRLSRTYNELRLEAFAAGDWRPVYDLVLTPQLDVDLLAGNWFASTHPTSPFRQALIVSRQMEGVRLALLENRLSIRRPGTPTEYRRLSVEALADSLRGDFNLPVAPAWTQMLTETVVRGDRLAAG
jgi:N-hydroxyarylamine O-acetyltransferase